MTRMKSKWMLLLHDKLSEQVILRKDCYEIETSLQTQIKHCVANLATKIVVVVVKGDEQKSQVYHNNLLFSYFFVN